MTLTFVKGEYGESKDIPVRENGAAADLSNYNGVTMTFKTQDEATTLETITGSHLTIETGGIVRWVPLSTETDMAGGLYTGQLEFTATGIVKKTYRFIVYVEGSLT